MEKKETRSSSSSSSNIPPEIIETIVSKLSSVKSLLRFKTVSKTWNTMISDPVFIQNHLHNSPNNLFVSKHRYTSEKGFSSVKLKDRKFQSEAVLENKHYKQNTILCECNGLLLLVHVRPYPRCSYEYALWNPSTRWEMYFEFPYGLNGEGIVVMNHGICYDPMSGDFKVVFIYRTNYAIFSCNNNSWTKKDIGTTYVPVNGVSGTGSGIFIDGVTYWIVGAYTQIVYFDPINDELKTLEKPEQLNSDGKFMLICMASLRGSLCLYGCSRDELTAQVWIKDKGIDACENIPNWKVYVTIDNVLLLLDPIWESEPLCFVENKILIQLEGHKYVYYSPSKKTIEDFGENERYYNEYIPYRNSLYFPTGVKTKTKTHNPVY